MRICEHDKRYVNAHMYDRRAYVYIYIYACVHMYTYEHLYNVLRLCVVPSTLRIMVKDVFNPMLLLSGEVEVHLIFFVNESGRFSSRVYKCECVSLSNVCEIQRLTTCEYVNISIHVYIYIYIQDRCTYIYIHVNIGQCKRTKNTYVCRSYLYNILHIRKHVDNNVDKKINGSMYM